MKINDIIYNPMFGFGIVKSTNDFTANVYFSNGELKSVFNSDNKFYEIIDKDFIDFIINEKFVNHFSFYTIAKIDKYIKEKRVTNVTYKNINNSIKITSQVLGTFNYNIEIEKNGRGISTSCTCPVGKKCKHAASTFSELKNIFQTIKNDKEIDNSLNKKFDLLYKTTPKIYDIKNFLKEVSNSSVDEYESLLAYISKKFYDFKGLRTLFTALALNDDAKEMLNHTSLNSNSAINSINQICSQINTARLYANNLIDIYNGEAKTLALYYYYNFKYNEALDIILKNNVYELFQIVEDAFNNSYKNDNFYNKIVNYLKNNTNTIIHDFLINNLPSDLRKTLYKDSNLSIPIKDYKLLDKIDVLKSLYQNKNYVDVYNYLSKSIDSLINVDDTLLSKIILSLFKNYKFAKERQYLLDLINKMPNSIYLHNYLANRYFDMQIQTFLDSKIMFKYLNPSYKIKEIDGDIYIDYLLKDSLLDEALRVSFKNDNVIEEMNYIDTYLTSNKDYLIEYINNLYKDKINKEKEDLKQNIKAKEEVRKKQELLNSLARLSYNFDSFDLVTKSNTFKIDVDLEFKFDPDNMISFKIGNTKKYVVKSAVAFLKRFISNESFKYGKDLEFIHNVANLNDKSKQLIEYLLQFKLDSLSNYSQDKYIKVSDRSINYIFNILKGSNILIDDKEYNLRLSNEKIDLFIDNTYTIRCNYDGTIKQFNDKIYFFNNQNNIIDYIEGNSDYFKVLVFMHRFNGISIKEVLPKFKEEVYSRFYDKIDISPEIVDDFKLSNLEIESYFDYHNKVLTHEVKLKRNDLIIFDNMLNNTMDINKFNKYKKYISNLGFIDNKIEDESDILNFLQMDFTDLKALSKVFLSETIKNMQIVSFTTPSVKIESKNDIMEVFLEESIYTSDELKEIYNAIKRKKKFILLKKDTIINLDNIEAKEFYDITNDLNLDSSNLYEAKALPLYQAMKAFAHEKNISIDSYLSNMISDIANFKNYKKEVPNVNANLREYQTDGFKWLSILSKYKMGGILADDMGLGKTLQIITLLKSDNTNRPSLIVCPKSLVFNWRYEFNKFDPLMEVIEIYGNSNIRHNVISNIEANKKVIYITNYDSLRNDYDLYTNDFNYLVLDEAQFIKNVNAYKSISVKKIKATHKFALTGTPIENNVIDLWSIFDFLMPGFFPDITTFKAKYMQNEEYTNDIKSLISPFVLRRTKQDVLKDLPDKFERIITAEMTTEQKKIYDSYILNAKDMLNNGGKAFDILPYLMRLRQICVDPSLFVDNFTGESGKMAVLKDLLKDYTTNNHKILLFSQFTQALDLVKKYLTDEGISYYILTGETKINDRIELVNNFNNNNDVKVFLISLKAGGTGLNLYGADTVIHLDPWWNVAAENQATDRAHRIGQTRNVEVIKLICSNSIEQNVIDIQNKKKDIVKALISDNDESITNVTLDNIKYILR